MRDLDVDGARFVDAGAVVCGRADESSIWTDGKQTIRPTQTQLAYLGAPQRVRALQLISSHLPCHVQVPETRYMNLAECYNRFSLFCSPVEDLFLGQ